MSKDMLFNEEARKAMFEGVKKLSRAVKATLGPTGRNVVIKKTGLPPFITKDGVTVAKEIEFEVFYVVIIRTGYIAKSGTFIPKFTIFFIHHSFSFNFQMQK